jgi:hypothetical protein
VTFRVGQTFALLGQLYDDIEFDIRQIRQLHDTDPADLQHPGQRTGGLSESVDDVNLIVGDENEAAAQQPQGEVGFAGTGWPEKQNAGAVTRDATAMEPGAGAIHVKSARQANDAPHAPVVARRGPPDAIWVRPARLEACTQNPVTSL